MLTQGLCVRGVAKGFDVSPDFVEPLGDRNLSPRLVTSKSTSRRSVSQLRYRGAFNDSEFPNG